MLSDEKITEIANHPDCNLGEHLQAHPFARAIEAEILRAQADAAPVACQHKRYSYDTNNQEGHCFDCGAEGRMQFVVPSNVSHPSLPAAQGLSEQDLATIRQARDVIYGGAESLKACHTIDGEWGSDNEAKEAYEREIVLCTKLRAILSRAATVAEPIETGGYVTHDQAFKNAAAYEKPRENHQGASETSRHDASGTSAPLESGAHEHHQHRSGQADVDQQKYHGDSCGAGVRGARELSSAETVAAQQQTEPGRFAVSKEWLAERLDRADDADCAAGQSQPKRPCDAPPGCNATNCLSCGEQQAEPVRDAEIDALVTELAYMLPSKRAEQLKALIRRLAAQSGQRAGITDDMRAAVRFAPSSAHWSQKLVEFFGPDAREGINALERQLREAQSGQRAGVAEQRNDLGVIDQRWYITLPPDEELHILLSEEAIRGAAHCIAQSFLSNPNQDDRDGIACHIRRMFLAAAPTQQQERSDGAQKALGWINDQTARILEGGQTVCTHVSPVKTEYAQVSLVRGQS